MSPELIFDQGQGDLFVAQVAGNIVGPGERASIEYAVEHLGVRLIMVLGHDQCDAVQAASENSAIHGPIGYLVRQIAPTIAHARTLSGNLLNNAKDTNIRYSLKTGDTEIRHTGG